MAGNWLSGEGARALVLAGECRGFFAGTEGTTWDRAYAERVLAEAANQREQLAERGESEFLPASHPHGAGRIAQL